MGEKINKTHDQIVAWLNESLQKVGAHMGNDEYENGYAQALVDVLSFVEKTQ